MPFRPRPRTSVWFGLAALVGLLGIGTTPARAQFGLAISGVGPINRSMGGASTAAPIDSAGALYWNPATIGALGRSEMEFGAGFLDPRTTLSSRVPAGALGPGTPPATVSGNNGGNNGVFLIPIVGLVYSPTDSPWSYGLGIFEIGGFGVNYPANPRNPILNPQFPVGQGVGPLYTQLQLFQFTPTVSLKVSDGFYLGAAANIDMGILSINPALFSPPALLMTPGGPGPVYPYGTQGRSRAGGGFQVGAYYEINEAWSIGASYKSTQWFDTYTFNSVNAQGQPVTPKFNIDFPQTVSVGLGYKGIDRLLLASDFRFLDYRDTTGFRHTGFDQSGALRGLGWQNVFALGTGAQYQWTDNLTTRIGYTFSLNPVGPAVASFNVGSPTIIQHSLAIGASYNVTKSFKLSITYAHDFQNSVTGPIIQPFVGAVPGSSVRSASTADSVYIGSTVMF
jgi:long-chain fatty acid transport protein